MLQAPIQLESRCCLGAVLLLRSLPTPSECALRRNLEKSPSGLYTLGHPRIKAGRGDSGRAFLNRYRAVKSVLQHNRSCFCAGCAGVAAPTPKPAASCTSMLTGGSSATQPCPTALQLPQNALGEEKRQIGANRLTQWLLGLLCCLWSPPGQDCPSLPALPGAGAARSSLFLPFLPSLRAVEACGVFGKQALPVIISGPSWEVITPAW